MLILAGENDPRCPIRQIDNYLARLRELGSRTRSTATTRATAPWWWRSGSGRCRDLDFARKHLNMS